MPGRAEPNAALLEAAHRQGGVVARPEPLSARTTPGTAHPKKSTTRPSRPTRTPPFPDPLPAIEKAASRVGRVAGAADAKHYDQAGAIQAAASQRELIQAARNPEVKPARIGSELRSKILPRSVRSPKDVWEEGGGRSWGEGGDGDLYGGAGEGGGEGHDLTD